MGRLVKWVGKLATFFALQKKWLARWDDFRTFCSAGIVDMELSDYLALAA